MLDVFDSGDGGGAAALGGPPKGGAGAPLHVSCKGRSVASLTRPRAGELTETITFDDLLSMPLPFDAGVYGAGQQSLLTAAHRSHHAYGAAPLPRPASWAGPLESLVIAQGTVVQRKQGCGGCKRGSSPQKHRAA